MPSKWFVITGAPCSGKTTVLNRLSEMGYATVPEAARAVIDEMIKDGKNSDDVKNGMLDFQNRVLELKVKIEENTPKDRITFFDRGIPDSIAYYELYGFDVGEALKFCSQEQYESVFILEKLPFQKDYARVEDDETATRLQELLTEAYSKLGHEIIFVPAMPVEERIRLILSHINRRLPS